MKTVKETTKVVKEIKFGYHFTDKYSAAFNIQKRHEGGIRLHMGAHHPAKQVLHYEDLRELAAELNAVADVLEENAK